MNDESLPTGTVGIFLDTENLSGWLKSEGARELLEWSSSFGPVLVRRAYGNWSSGNINTRQGELVRMGFELVHCWHPVRGKNSADIQLVVDAMDYARRMPDLTWFVLATGDADFGPLFRRLREIGREVVGVGYRSALSEAVKTSCTRFYTIQREETRPLRAPASASELSEAHDLLERSLAAFDGPANVGTLKARILKLDPSFDERALGFPSFLDFLRSATDSVQLVEDSGSWAALAIGDSRQTTQLPSPEPLDDDALETAYRSRLRRKPIAWQFIEPDVLTRVHREAIHHLVEPFERGEAVERLLAEIGDDTTQVDVRKAFRLFIKIGAIFKDPAPVDPERPWKVEARLTEGEILARLDAELIARLVNICEKTELRFSPQVARRLLTCADDAERSTRAIHLGKRLATAFTAERTASLG